jgi:thiol-disulfide isomerase/thioredoxin
MTSTKKCFQTIIKIVVLILFSNLLLNCKNDKEELKADDNVFEIVIKTDNDIDSLSMYPSMVSKKFLDTIYASLFKGYLKNGSVSFTGKKLPHPYMFDILEEKNGFSDKFFVDNGTTKVFIDFKDKNNTIHIPAKFKSKAQTEYEELKTLGLKKIDSLRRKSKTREERGFLNLKRDSTIVNYIHKNPSSYVPLWLMVNYFPHSNKRYNKMYDESLHLFSEDIKKTEMFKKLKSAIEDTKKVSISNKLMPLKNLDLEPVNFRLSDIKNKEYILLDFWFSNCSPCLAQMPAYIPLYKKYKDMGFEIISISVDDTNKIQDWKDVIQERNFDWVHYLDENGNETGKLNILSFPTTFLIDKQGAVLEKNISSKNLEEILNAKIEKK